MGRNKEQLSLPLLIPKQELRSVIKQHWNVTFARQNKISVYAKRIMSLVLAQIHDNDLTLKPFYQIHISEIVSNAKVDRNTAYKEVKKALSELMDQKWEFEDINGSKYTPRHIVDTTKMLENDGFEYGYDSGVLTVVLNPALKPFFIELGHYTSYGLTEYMKFKSWYSMRLYELLSAYKDTGKWFVSIDEYRSLMDCNDKYPLAKDLIAKTLKEPLEELEGTKMDFSYFLHCGKGEGRGRPKIVGLEFILTKKALKNIPSEWLENKITGPLIKILLEKYKISKENIITYCPALGNKQIGELIRSWDMKELSGDRINDKLRYCNKVFVKLGKEAIAKKESTLQTEIA